MDRISVLLVSNNRLLRRSLREALSGEEGFLIQESDNGDKAFSKVRNLLPHGVIIDADLPLSGGLELASRIGRDLPAVFVIIVASREDEDELYNAICVGCAAYLLKDMASAQLAATVRQAYQKEYPINEIIIAKPGVASRVLEQFRRFALSAGEGLDEPIAPLSREELGILQHVARGRANKAIASMLGIEEQTVKNYVIGIRRKLAANDRAHAVFLAIKHGWLKTE